jgi:hypothetical protein
LERASRRRGYGKEGMLLRGTKAPRGLACIKDSRLAGNRATSRTGSYAAWWEGAPGLQVVPIIDLTSLVLPTSALPYRPGPGTARISASAFGCQFSVRIRLELAIRYRSAGPRQIFDGTGGAVGPIFA